MQKPCFKEYGKEYQFAHMIETDGLGCSVLFVKNTVAKNYYKPDVSVKKFCYMEDMDAEQVALLANKRVVGIDPGKADLIYAAATPENEDATPQNVTFFRYTQNQRWSEGKVRTYRKKHRRLVKEESVQGKSVEKWQTELSTHNHKTLDPAKFVAYLIAKNATNALLSPFYSEPIHRQMKWNAKTNLRRSEDRMINRFKSKFGGPDEVVIAYGDFEQRQHMKYREPSMGVGMRKLFRRHGYANLFLIDEHRTSCRCFDCTGENHTFKLVENPRPWKRDEMPRILRHGLLKCKTCTKLWNRNANGALNICLLGKKIIRNEPRPDYLKRGTPIPEQEEPAAQAGPSSSSVSSRKRRAPSRPRSPCASKPKKSKPTPSTFTELTTLYPRVFNSVSL